MSLLSGVSSGVWQTRRATSRSLHLQLQPCPAGLLIGSPSSCLPAIGPPGSSIITPLGFFYLHTLKVNLAIKELGGDRTRRLLPSQIWIDFTILSFSDFCLFFTSFFVFNPLFLTLPPWLWFSWSVMWSTDLYRAQYSTHTDTSTK